MNDVIEIIFCPVHGILGWLLICWPCAFFALKKFTIFLLTCATKHEKSAANSKK